MSFNYIDAEIRFEKDPTLQEKFGTLENYIESEKLALKRESVMTFGKDTSDSIRNSVKGWALEKEAKKASAEEQYYAALEQYEGMKHERYTADNKLQYTFKNYGEESTQYTDAFRKFDLSSKSAFESDINLSIARDRFNNANMNAFKAYLISEQG